jgi:hypothetical protein
MVFALEVLSNLHPNREADAETQVVILLPPERSSAQAIACMRKALFKFCELPGYHRKPKLTFVCRSTFPTNEYMELKRTLDDINQLSQWGSFNVQNARLTYSTNVRVVKPKKKKKSKH